MPPDDIPPDVCEQIKECQAGQPKTTPDWIAWAAIVLNAVFTITAFWWSQRKEALSKYKCLHFLAVEFDHVMHIMDATVLQCEAVYDRLVNSGNVQSVSSQQAFADVFQPSAASNAGLRQTGDIGLKSAIQVRGLRVRALCEGARRLKDEAEVLCKVTRSSEDRRHVQRLIECLATITYIDPALSLEDPSYLSRLVTRDLAADLLRSGRRVLAICCRGLLTPPSTVQRLFGFRLLMSTERRQSYEIWEKYSAKTVDYSRPVVHPGPCKTEGWPDPKRKNAPIKAFEASLPTLPDLKDVAATVFNNAAGISDATLAGLREIHISCVDKDAEDFSVQRVQLTSIPTS